MTSTTRIEPQVCQQRRDELIDALRYLSEDDKRELGIWEGSIESIVEELVGNMGCAA